MASVLSSSRLLDPAAPRWNREGAETLREADGELVRRAVGGDRSAWRILYERHRDFVFRVASRHLGDDAEARDVAQDVFVNVFTRAEGYQPVGPFRTYLYRVVANRCLNERARARHRRRASGRDAGDDVLAGTPDRAASPEEQLVRAQERERVRSAIGRLPERQRLAVILSRFEGLSYEEIAAALETTIPSVESLLFRARQALARDLGAP